MTVLEHINVIRYVISDECITTTMSLEFEAEKKLGLYYDDPLSKREVVDSFREKYEDKIDEIMLFNGYYHHHTAIHPGGIRKLNPVSAEVKPYEGRFGIGYTVHRYKEGSDNSHYVDYWIKED